MRLEKAAAILKLARYMSSNFDGVTLDEIEQRFKVERRTAERMRDAVEMEFGTLDVIKDDKKKRFRLSAKGIGNFATVPTAEELLELENAARALDTSQASDRAAQLRSLRDKIGASLREADRRRLTRNTADQLCAEALACKVGPRPMTDPMALSALRRALLEEKVVRFNYGGKDASPPKSRMVVPFGLLLGPHYYLVAVTKNRSEPFLYRLDHIHDIEVTEEHGAPPETFKLKAFAERSFGVFQEEPEDIVLRFAPSAARDARAYLFHPTQTMTDEPDGSLTVRFRAGGLLQIAHHLMTWGPTATVVAPPRLQEIMRNQVEALYAHHVTPQPSVGLKRRPSTRNSSKSSSRTKPITNVSGS
ncbi:MAG: WYL domain-containing protein [Hyphomicrobiales bacterium]|nr:WYL domain-containing protein [Hyphomicrobiales bacterium]MDE2116073.1 WYL domain-containing protein [Hyphomicrobiales bacterium]